MAKDTSWLQAILDCMRRVKAKYHNVRFLSPEIKRDSIRKNRCACAGTSGLEHGELVAF